MDKKTNILSNTQDINPVNTRTIGAPEGIYILYLEDYVHTFFKKLLADKPQNTPVTDGYKKEGDQKYQQEYQQEYQIEKTLQQDVALYGRSLEENGRYRIVISGAAILDGGIEKIQQLNNTYFPSCAYIGNAKASLNRDSKLRLELTLRSTKVILDDFYIYYDQNEEMQNYLVEWNTTRENDKGKVILSPTEHDTYTRGNMGDAVRLSRITQAYNREEAKVSFMWNVMNVLCLGFVVCVMAYGIISMNNYNKMQNMQANIDYCMAFIEENTSFLLNAAKTSTDQSQPVSVMHQDMQTENGITTQDVLQQDNTDVAAVQEGPGTATETEQASQEQEAEAMQALAQAERALETSRPAIVSDAAQSAAEQDTQPVQDQTSTPQYYIVRKGDTLRTICYNIYGDYSRVDEVCRWNDIDDTNNILYGQKLLLP